ncbi:GntR family transcriptional regulator [Streptomyces sp. NPDC012510]|uniref:GntR family transcriptional regulator n=1 Tax=Streptomyces sp. NPDC012510 TaxID=3364838 RepID=UPI0036EC65C5
MSLDSPVPRRLLSDEVFHRLRDSIVRGELAPGEKVRDGELAERLGLSRTPVREALAGWRTWGSSKPSPVSTPVSPPWTAARSRRRSPFCAPSTGRPSKRPFRS